VQQATQREELEVFQVRVPDWLAVTRGGAPPGSLMTPQTAPGPWVGLWWQLDR